MADEPTEPIEHNEPSGTLGEGETEAAPTASVSQVRSAGAFPVNGALDVRVGSIADFPHTLAERRLSGGNRSSNVCF